MTSDAGVRGDEFGLDAPPLLSRSTVDRSEMLRSEASNSAGLWTSGRVILVDVKGRTPLVDDRLASRPAIEYGEVPTQTSVLLGEQDGVGYWALRAEHEGTEDWKDLRTAGVVLDDTGAGLLTTAVGLLSWHDNAGYCARCGAATIRVRGGWERRCTGCDREEYPRTDPAVICLVHDGADHVLLARQPVWPPYRYSVLAGFVEVGESLEACVRREVEEEVGVRVSNVRYLGSQPWPFPRSLMLGFAAMADRGEPIRPADGEIEDARWIHRDDVRAALDGEGEVVAGLRMPPGISIAHRMLRGWVADA